MTINTPNTDVQSEDDEQPSSHSDCYTVDELARKVGMSPRNIRAHQARKLLAAPVRRGRAAYYEDSHVRRLEAIKALQRQGFNLVSIEAILGVRASDPGNRALATTLNRLITEQPSLVYALGRHNVVGRTDDGTVRLARPRALRSALELRRVGVKTAPSLQVMVEVLDSVQALAQQLVEATGSRVLSLAPELAGGPARSWEDVDRITVSLTQGIVDLLSNAFRVAVENCGEATVSALIAGRADLDVQIESSEMIDNG